MEANLFLFISLLSLNLEHCRWLIEAFLHRPLHYCSPSVHTSAIDWYWKDTSSKPIYLLWLLLLIRCTTPLSPQRKRNNNQHKSALYFPDCKARWDIRFLPIDSDNMKKISHISIYLSVFLMSNSVHPRHLFSLLLPSSSSEPNTTALALEMVTQWTKASSLRLKFMSAASMPILAMPSQRPTYWDLFSMKRATTSPSWRETEGSVKLNGAKRIILPF